MSPDDLVGKVADLALHDEPRVQDDLKVPMAPESRGYVVSVVNKTTILVQERFEETYNFYALDEDSVCIDPDKKFPELHDEILIYKRSTNGAVRHIDEYDVIPLEDDEEEDEEEEVALVVNMVSPGVISVISARIPVPVLVQCDFNVARHDFVMGTTIRLRPHFVPLINSHGLYCVIKDYDLEKQEPSASGLSCLTHIRKLTDKEKKKLETNCRNVVDLTFEEAVQFIRDPYIAISYLEKHIENDSGRQHTVHVEGCSYINRQTAPPTYMISLFLSRSQADKCIQSQSNHTWRVGCELSIEHPEIYRITREGKRMYSEGGMTVDSIKPWHEGTVKVDLKPASRSKDLFDLLLRVHNTTPLNSKKNDEGERDLFKVGPLLECGTSIAENLEAYFKRFFENKKLFNAWRGFTDPCTDPVPKLHEDFLVADCRLDPSQRTALRTAICRDGFTSVEAPPGSGKTFLIASIVALKKEQDTVTKGRICISAYTNIAITNALDITHKFFQDITKARQYSRSAEGQVEGKSKDISLLDMALNPDKHIDIQQHKHLLKAVVDYEDACQALETQQEIRGGLTTVAKKDASRAILKQNFLAAFCPFLIGSTCELVARRSMGNEKKAALDIKEGRNPDLSKCITHLILDEASQLPPHMALAVYVALPTLEKITVIGDTKQLGPYTTVDEGSFAHKLIGLGELERLNRNMCTSVTALERVYRCHPRILDILLKPIYGPRLTAGTAEKDRSLAIDAKLPVAQDGKRSPALFVNVEGHCNNGYNQEEAEVVLAFVEKLRKKGITGEDVAIVCNHRAQRERISARLKGQGEIGILKTSVAVHTVDSFQGKEAKVVLVLTTKTCYNENQNVIQHTLSFVAHPNRGTVAVSRAQHAVYVFGQWEALVQTPFWSQFVDSMVKNKALVNSNWTPAKDDLYRKIVKAAAY